MSKENSVDTYPNLCTMNWIGIKDKAFYLYRKHFRLFIGIALIYLVFLKSTQNPLSINDLSIRGYENAKKCSLIDPYYVKKTPCFQYKIK